ncbi:unnamed protein product [Lactuca saligna]|uniref:Oxidoreductase FAD/NAD(P)-binding domain-containing protein n=1 Tax=Lactuca saligna TaxID=75948 RepID=A0AA35YVI1_LACSI|nr:unnamed protein product [Lactuca saligna]
MVFFIIIPFLGMASCSVEKYTSITIRTNLIEPRCCSSLFSRPEWLPVLNHSTGPLMLPGSGPGPAHSSLGSSNSVHGTNLPSASSPLNPAVRNGNQSSVPPKPPIFDPLDSSSTLFLTCFFPTSFPHLLVVDHELVEKYKVVRAILENPSDKTKVHLIYANVTSDDILLKAKLEGRTSNYPDHFKVYYVLNQPPEGWTGGVGFVSKEMIQDHLPGHSSNIKGKYPGCAHFAIRGGCTVSITEYQLPRSNDRRRMYKRLNEEAERYLEDFISIIKDSKFSSFDGERSDTSSTLVGATKPIQNSSPCHVDVVAGMKSVPVEMEGVNLPWLKWNDTDVVPSTPIIQTPKTLKPKLWDPYQNLELIQEQQGNNHGSWDPPVHDKSVASTYIREREIHYGCLDMNKYLELQKNEQLMFDRWRERNVIRSGGLLLSGVLVKIFSGNSQLDMNHVGMGAAILGMQAPVGFLVDKDLTTSATPYYQGQLQCQRTPRFLRRLEVSLFYQGCTMVSIHIAVYLFEIASPIKNSDLELFSLPALYGANINHLILYGEWWSLLTPMFLVQD